MINAADRYVSVLDRGVTCSTRTDDVKGSRSNPSGLTETHSCAARRLILRKVGRKRVGMTVPRNPAASTHRRTSVGCHRWWAAVLLITSCSSSHGQPVESVDGVVTGTVYSAPSCPLERANSPCPPRPVAGAAVVAFVGHRRRAATHTGGDGRFRLELSYGRYTIRATNVGPYASTASKTVDVSAVPISIEITVDSGIR